MANPEATSAQPAFDAPPVSDKRGNLSDSAQNLLHSTQPKTADDIVKERSYWSGFVKTGVSEHLQRVQIDFGPQKSDEAIAAEAQRLSNVSANINAAGRTESSARLNPDIPLPQSGDRQPDTRPSAGDRQGAGERQGAGDRRSADAGEHNRPYAPGLNRGEGPYQALRRMGLDHAEAARQARRINTESGQSSYRQGDKFRLNEDGSISLRQDSRTAPGSYSETTRRDGRTTQRRETDAQGNWHESTYDSQGQVSVERSHTRDGQGNVTDTSRDRTGTTTDRYDSEGRQRSSERKNNDGSLSGWTINQDGSRTAYRQSDANHRQETVTRDGRIVSESRRDTTPDGPVTVQRDYNPAGGYSERHSFGDQSRNYTRDVSADGKIVLTDAVGMKTDVFGGTPEFQQRAFDQIRQIPEDHRRLLASQGVRYALGGRVSDVNPSLRDVQPRGWPDGRTWDDADGAYFPETKQIVVTETTRSGPSERTNGVLRHETGHALDHVLGDYSDSADFRNAFVQDTSRFSDEQRRTNRYLLQDHGAGREETFAELYGALNGSSANSGQTEQVLRDFPATAALMRRRIAAIGRR